MRRERALKVVLVVVGLIFLAGVYPVAQSLWHQDQSMYTFDMMLSLYIALGIFLLIAARNPAANRSLIAFTAWSCFAHGAVMTVTSFSMGGYRPDIWGVPVLVIIGAALLALAPSKLSAVLPHV
jgi:hypothetical protein